MRTPEPCLCGDPLCKRCFPGGFKPEPEVFQAIESLIDVATAQHYDRQSEESFIECRVCGGWDEHTFWCFVPAILRWQQQGDAK